MYLHNFTTLIVLLMVAVSSDVSQTSGVSGIDNIYTISTHYLYIIYTLSIHYLHTIYVCSDVSLTSGVSGRSGRSSVSRARYYLYTDTIYTLSTHYLHIIYTLSTHYLHTAAPSSRQTRGSRLAPPPGPPTETCPLTTRNFYNNTTLLRENMIWRS